MRQFDEQLAYRQTLSCPNCGDHSLDARALDLLKSDRLDDKQRARVAYGLREVRPDVVITIDLLRDLLRTCELPPAMERIDNLVLYLARKFAPGERAHLQLRYLRATIGAATDNEVLWVIEQAKQLRLIEGTVPKLSSAYNDVSTLNDAALTVQGWQRQAELLRSGAGSRHAFMAMKFNDPELDLVLNDHMRPAVAQTGFDLRTLSGPHQTAGSIDNRMRVEIRTSRFMVCDLTHGNQGAYWEAGFAEGLGRDVFYTCRNDVLDAKQVHFDTAHQLIIAWNPQDLAPAMQALKNAIRATLPGEARMTDQ